jgi:hypothetical protein
MSDYVNIELVVTKYCTLTLVIPKVVADGTECQRSGWVGMHGGIIGVVLDAEQDGKLGKLSIFSLRVVAITGTVEIRLEPETATTG